jgi:carbonic anhydrase
MAAPFSKLSRQSVLVLSVLAALSIAENSRAAEHAEHAEKADKTEAAASAEAPAKLAQKKPVVRTLGPGDPLDMLRERLAEKLGAARSTDASNPNVVRVVAKANSPMITELAEPPAARTPRRKPAASDPDRSLPTVAAHWDYSGAGGPEAWGQMKPEFSKCSSGTRQSPIDIRDGFKVDLEPVTFDYKPSAFRVIDNGHTVQVNVAPGNFIDVMGRRFELVQFHFHRPSEERIDGKQFDMVVHLVHKDLEGHLAVIAVLLTRGSAQPIVQSVWNNLPLEKGEELAARTPLNPADLLPTERNYFTYMGSLTTPPCSEGVLWMVMKKPVEVSTDQIGIFSRLYPMNARPVQSASGRLIKESN